LEQKETDRKKKNKIEKRENKKKSEEEKEKLDEKNEERKLVRDAWDARKKEQALLGTS